MDADFILWCAVGGGASLVLALILGPPVSFWWNRFTASIDDAIEDHTLNWKERSAVGSAQGQFKHAEEKFSQWFHGRFSGSLDWGTEMDDDLIKAKDLMPTIRQLLETELPTTIRRCNMVHHRMAQLTNAVHMREVAYEPECLSSRQWTFLMLRETGKLLEQYPASLILEAPELLDASVIVRKNLAPICSNCPYVRQNVQQAGDRCPAAQVLRD